VAGVIARRAGPILLAGAIAWAPLGTAALAAPVARKVIIDQDCAGPGGTDMQAVLALLNAPDVQVLGIGVVTGDAWRDEEIQHTLRLLEIIGRTDVPVLPGAVFPLVNRKEYTERWETLYGKIPYQGAWNYGHPVHGPYDIPPLPEGAPAIKASDEAAAAFMVRMVHRSPHQVTIYAAGPLTDLAIAIALDPHFAELAKELIVMGGSISPVTDDPQFGPTPRREFNFWMDPEAARAVLHAPWPKVTMTTVDISVKTRMDKALVDRIARGGTPGAKYVAKYAEGSYLWDELAAVAWVDPTVVTKKRELFIDVSIDHGPTYGETLAWLPGEQPGLGEQRVEVLQELDQDRFYRRFAELITGTVQ
jgi:inosine-uridine nucleoside N-ribohydrolase